MGFLLFLNRYEKDNIPHLLFIFYFLRSTSSKDHPKDFVVPNLKPMGSEKFLDLNSDYIFDQESLHTFELKIPGTSLRKIDSDPVKEEYLKVFNF
ncbi:MAG: hypothetical protein CM1200mP1_10500 [Candidatus Neomarinimicrobiota bacterium]|nr:MAG: hypothetical protein CM1200mP1_10500 [Candidatus Neomarinimicrobiota bacterium]